MVSNHLKLLSTTNSSSNSTWTALIVATMLSVGGGMMIIATRKDSNLIAWMIRRLPFDLLGLKAGDDNGMPKLPKDVVQYSQVPKNSNAFTYHTIPKGLLRQHNTKKGTWGVIRVIQGKLEYQINADPQNFRTFELTPDRHGVIPPTILHQVKPLTDDIQFVVEFYRLPNDACPVDEKRE